jgi:hypothetical protein
VTESSLNPVVAIFSRTVPKAGDPIAKLVLDLKILLGKEKYKAMNFGAFAVFLTLDKEFQLDEKRDEAKKAIVDWAAEIGKDGGIGGLALGLAGKEADAVKAWNIGADDEIVVVLYHRLKIVQRWKYEAGKFGEDDVKAIITATEAELQKK